jgi:hypothetical protein
LLLWLSLWMCDSESRCISVREMRPNNQWLMLF